MWWNSFSTSSACSREIAVIFATSRLTFCTSSSESCCSSSALDCSPSTISSMAALRKRGMTSPSGLGGVEDHGRQISLLPDPGPEDLRRNLRVLRDLFAQVLGQHLGRLGDHRRELQRVQRLRLQLAARAQPAPPAGFDLLLQAASRRSRPAARPFRPRPRQAGRSSPARTAGLLLLPAQQPASRKLQAAEAPAAAAARHDAVVHLSSLNPPAGPPAMRGAGAGAGATAEAPAAGWSRRAGSRSRIDRRARR